MQRAQTETAKRPENKAVTQPADDELTAIEDPSRFQSQPDFWEGEGWEVRTVLPAGSFATVQGANCCRSEA